MDRFLRVIFTLLFLIASVSDALEYAATPHIGGLIGSKAQGRSSIFASTAAPGTVDGRIRMGLSSLVGLLWCTFSFWGDSVTLVMFVTLIVTGTVQILACILVKKNDVVGIKLPGAWRVLVYLIFLIFFRAGELIYVNL